MVSAPVCTGPVGNVSYGSAHLNVRQPLRVQSRTRLTTRQNQIQSKKCCFKPKRSASETVCSSAEDSPEAANKSQDRLKQGLSKAAALSWAPFAIALPLCFGDSGHGSNNGSSGGGGGGDGSGSGGQGDHSRNIVAELAADSSEEEEEDEDDEEDEEDEEEEVSLASMPLCDQNYCLLRANNSVHHLKDTQ